MSHRNGAMISMIHCAYTESIVSHRLPDPIARSGARPITHLGDRTSPKALKG
jgi:hypothetical protein